MSKRHAFYGNVFSKAFSGFNGYRDTQGPLHPDDRFSNRLGNMTCDARTLKQTPGQVLDIRMASGVHNAMADEDSRVIACVSDLYYEVL